LGCETPSSARCPLDSFSLLSTRSMGLCMILGDSSSLSSPFLFVTSAKDSGPCQVLAALFVSRYIKMAGLAPAS